MTPTTHLPPLSEKNRRRFFISLVLIFSIAVPLMVFYAIGYRFDFNGDIQNIKAVGGLYIASGISDGVMYVDEKRVDNMRIFRSAAYIQNLEEGVHEVHIQRDGLYTWVKDLPVFAHLVTEAESFNMPVRPQIRIATEWVDNAGRGVLFESATTTHFAFASSTVSYVLAPGSATTTFTRDIEHTYVASLFASSTQETEMLRQLKLLQEQQSERFNFSSATVTVPTTTATTTKLFRDSLLFERDGEVYVTWIGRNADRPYYYCVRYAGSKMTKELYGEHVYEQLSEQVASSTDLHSAALVGERLCRDMIRIDRLRQDVRWFNFMPNSEHIVMMLLGDGLYAVEVDDRSWQNTQLLYPGSDLQVLIDGERIYIQDGDYYLELVTQIAA